MDIKRGSLVTLDNSNNYVVVSKVEYQNKSFLYLVDIENNSNMKFGYEKQDGNVLKIVEVKDDDTIRNLVPLFDEDIKDALNN